MKNTNNSCQVGLFNDKSEVEKYYRIVKDSADDENGGIDSNVFQYLKSILPKNLFGQKVIDVGCGNARWSEYLLRHNAEKVFAIDKDPQAISYARKRKCTSGYINLNIIQCDMRKLPIKTGTIDKALSLFSLMYFNDLDEIVLEISRTLKNGGRFYIATNIIEVKDGAHKDLLIGKSIDLVLGFNETIIRPNMYQPIEQYKRAFARAGLTIEKEMHFIPKGVFIDDKCKYKDKIKLRSAVYELEKIKV